jgi:hypothetical protein
MSPCYNVKLCEHEMMEVNQLTRQLKDLQERILCLRGFL